MSRWSYVKGILEVSPYGRTQAECRYILETVLAHLPKVTGSEGNMDTHIIQCAGHNISCSHNEFSEYIEEGWMQYQDNYIVVVEGNLRDKEFNETYREFIKWLNRFVKRVWIDSCIVQVKGSDNNHKMKSSMIELDNLYKYLEDYSWEGKNTVNWCEYLIWRSPKNEKGQMLCGKPDFPDGSFLNNGIRSEL